MASLLHCCHDECSCSSGFAVGVWERKKLEVGNISLLRRTGERGEIGLEFNSHFRLCRLVNYLAEVQGGRTTLHYAADFGRVSREWVGGKKSV